MDLISDMPSTPTIYDVARLAGVSIATVSRVLNGHANLRPQTKETVLQAVRDLQFVPNNAARGLSSGSKRVLGLLFVRGPAEGDLLAVEQESLLFTDSVIRGAERSASARGFSLLLGGINDSSDDVGIDDLISKCDGLILLDRSVPERHLPSLAKRIPTILLAGSGRSRSTLTVRVDNFGATRELAMHLGGHHGRTRLAFLSGFEDSPDSTARREGFIAGAAEVGAVVEEGELWSSDYTSAGAVRSLNERLGTGEPMPLGIGCANDQAAIGAIHALQHAGYKVPEDIAVTGFDDVSVARHVSPTLTTVRQPAQQMGSTAVDTLLALIDGQIESLASTVLPTRVVLRQSCGCPQ